jgi:hypothetical protein
MQVIQQLLMGMFPDSKTQLSQLAADISAVAPRKQGRAALRALLQGTTVLPAAFVNGWLPNSADVQSLGSEVAAMSGILFDALQQYLQRASFADAAQRKELLERTLQLLGVMAGAVSSILAGGLQDASLLKLAEQTRLALEQLRCLEACLPGFSYLLDAELQDALAQHKGWLQEQQQLSVAFALEQSLQQPASTALFAAVAASLSHSSPSSVPVCLALQAAATAWQHHIAVPAAVLREGACQQSSGGLLADIREMEALDAVLRLKKPVAEVVEQFSTYCERADTSAGLSAVSADTQVRYNDFCRAVAELQAHPCVQLLGSHVNGVSVDAHQKLLEGWQAAQAGVLPGRSKEADEVPCKELMQNVVDAALSCPMFRKELLATSAHVLQNTHPLLWLWLWHCTMGEPLGTTRIFSSDELELMSLAEVAKLGPALVLVAGPGHVAAAVVETTAVTYIQAGQHAGMARSAPVHWLHEQQVQLSTPFATSYSASVLEGCGRCSELEVSSLSIVMKLHAAVTAEHLAAVGSTSPSYMLRLLRACSQQLTSASNNSRTFASAFQVAAASLEAVRTLSNAARNPLYSPPSATGDESQESARSRHKGFQIIAPQLKIDGQAAEQLLHNKEHMLLRTPSAIRAAALQLLRAAALGGQVSGQGALRVLDVLEQQAQQLAAYSSYQQLFFEQKRMWKVLLRCSTKSLQQEPAQLWMQQIDPQMALTLANLCTQISSCFSFSSSSVRVGPCPQLLFVTAEELLSSLLQAWHVAPAVQAANELQGVFARMQAALEAACTDTSPLETADLEQSVLQPAADHGSLSTRERYWKVEVEHAQQEVRSILKEARGLRSPPPLIIAEALTLADDLSKLDVALVTEQRLKEWLYEPKRLRDKLLLYASELDAPHPLVLRLPDQYRSLRAAAAHIPDSAWAITDKGADAVSSLPEVHHLTDLQHSIEQLAAGTRANSRDKAAHTAAPEEAARQYMQQVLRATLQESCWQQLLGSTAATQEAISGNGAVSSADAGKLSTLAFVLSERLGGIVAQRELEMGAVASLTQQTVAECVKEYLLFRRELLLGEARLMPGDYDGMAAAFKDLTEVHGPLNLITLQPHLEHLHSCEYVVDAELKRYTAASGCSMQPVALAPQDVVALFAPSSAGAASKVLGCKVLAGCAAAGVDEAAGDSAAVQADMCSGVQEQLLAASFTYKAAPGGQATPVFSGAWAAEQLSSSACDFFEALPGLKRQLEQLEVPHQIILSSCGASQVTDSNLALQLAVAMQILDMCRQAASAVQWDHLVLLVDVEDAAVAGHKRDVFLAQQEVKRLEAERMSLSTKVAEKEQQLRECKGCLATLQAQHQQGMYGYHYEAGLMESKVRKLEEALSKLRQDSRGCEEAQAEKVASASLLDETYCSTRTAAAHALLQQLRHCTDIITSQVDVCMQLRTSGRDMPLATASSLGHLRTSGTQPEQLLQMCAELSSISSAAGELLKLCEEGCQPQDPLRAAVRWLAERVLLASDAGQNSAQVLAKQLTFSQEFAASFHAERLLQQFADCLATEIPALISAAASCTCTAASVTPVACNLLEACRANVPPVATSLEPWQAAHAAFLMGATHALNVVAVALKLCSMRAASCQSREVEPLLQLADSTAVQLGLQLLDLPQGEVELQGLLDTLQLHHPCMMKSLQMLPDTACHGAFLNPLAWSHRAKTRAADLGPDLLYPASFLAGGLFDELSLLVRSTASTEGGQLTCPKGLRQDDVRALRACVQHFAEIAQHDLAEISHDAFLANITSSGALDRLGLAVEATSRQLGLGRSGMKEHCSSLETRSSFLLKELLQASVQSTGSQFKKFLEASGGRLARFNRDATEFLTSVPEGDTGFFAAEVDTSVVTLSDIYDVGKFAKLLEDCDRQSLMQYRLYPDQVEHWLGGNYVQVQLLVHSIFKAGDMMMSVYDFCPHLLRVSSLADKHRSMVTMALHVMACPLAVLQPVAKSSSSGSISSTVGGEGVSVFEEEGPGDAAGAANDGSYLLLTELLSEVRALPQTWMFSEMEGVMLAELESLAQKISADVEGLQPEAASVQQQRQDWCDAAEVLVEGLSASRTGAFTLLVDQFRKNKEELQQKQDIYRKLVAAADQQVGAALQQCYERQQWDSRSFGGVIAGREQLQRVLRAVEELEDVVPNG